jgi:PadR family transcriptional regulator AphA
LPARPASTRYALLGLLSLGPGSGYDLKRRAETSVGHFWHESYGQIYPTLKRLTADGLITCAVERPRRPGRPDRLVYTITPIGVAALETWLATPPRTEPFRSELLLKLFFGPHGSPPLLAGYLCRVREEELARLAQFQRIDADLRRKHARAEGLPFWLMTLNYGKLRSRAIVEWVDATLPGLQTASRSARATAAPDKRARNAGAPRSPSKRVNA